VASYVQNNCNQGYSFKCECGNCPVLRYYPFRTILRHDRFWRTWGPSNHKKSRFSELIVQCFWPNWENMRQFYMEQRNKLIYNKLWPHNIICWVSPSSNVKIHVSLEMSNQAMNTGGIVAFNKSKVSIPESNFRQVNESDNTKPGTTFPNPPEFDLSLSSTLQVVFVA